MTCCQSSSYRDRGTHPPLTQSPTRPGIAANGSVPGHGDGGGGGATGVPADAVILL